MADSATPISPASDAGSQKLGGRVVVFHEAHEIYFDHPLPRFSTSGARAYQARSVRGGSEIAYISERHSIPRVKFSERYQGLQNTTQARLTARGIIRCPDGFERYMFVYENTFGNPLIPDPSTPKAYNMRPDLVMGAVLRPILGMLQELHNMDLAHGGIRVDNLFDGGQNLIQSVRLGDCLAQTYLSAQPSLYLPPNLSIAMPSGRGLETPIDDIYALGVTCALLLRSNDSMFGKTDEEILISKLELGTFSTLIEGDRIPGNVLELLRGMLYDDPHVRWTANDVADWFDSKRTTRRSGSARLKGSRHLLLRQHKIFFPTVLAYYLPTMVDDAIVLINSDEIRQWIRRSVSDAKMDHRYNFAIESVREYIGGANYHDQLICRVAIGLEPSFPISYQGLRFFFDSMGTVLAELMASGRDVKAIADLINDQTAIFWMNTQAEIPADINMLISRSEQCQQFLKQSSIGYGIERCVYALASDVPCLSQNLRGYYVDSPARLLHALNQMAETHDRPVRVLDRHMIAFLSVRDRRMVDSFLPDLNSTESYRQILGVLGVLGGIQKTERVGSLPGLSKWIHTLLDPVYERFHDRDLRVMLRKKMNDMKDQGMIGRMADTLFDREMAKRDQYEYRFATKEYYFLSLEQYGLKEALKQKEEYGTKAGREIAALISGVVMALAVVGFILIKINQGSMPW